MDAELPDPSIRKAVSRRLLVSGLVGAGTSLLLLPVTALALWPVWAVVQLVVALPYWLFLVSYLLVGAPLFTRPVQRVILSRMLRLREPMPEEARLLYPPWGAALQRTGASPRRYVLWVEDHPGYDTSAVAGGHVVDVSTGVLDTLGPDGLEAVLAQKLCHNRGLHGAGDLVGFWLAAPITVVATLGGLLERLVVRIGYLTSRSRIDDFGWISLVLIPVSLLLRFLVWLANVTVSITSGLGQVLWRHDIYAADRAAVDLGYGPELASALSCFDDQPSGEQRKLSLPPPIARRITRIHARMLGPGGAVA